MARAKSFDTYIEGLNQVLRAFKALPKEASAELRQASQAVASQHMVPAWQNAALYGAGPWGQVIAASVKVKRDRIPAVQIGGNRKVLSGGGTATMVRAPSDLGPAGKWYSKPEEERTFAPFQRTDWMTRVRGYQGPALQEWAQAVDRIVAKWSTL
jgi:hypothetical protein